MAVFSEMLVSEGLVFYCDNIVRGYEWKHHQEKITRLKGMIICPHGAGDKSSSDGMNTVRTNWSKHFENPFISKVRSRLAGQQTTVGASLCTYGLGLSVGGPVPKSSR